MWSEGGSQWKEAGDEGMTDIRINVIPFKVWLQAIQLCRRNVMGHQRKWVDRGTVEVG